MDINQVLRKLNASKPTDLFLVSIMPNGQVLAGMEAPHAIELHRNIMLYVDMLEDKIQGKDPDWEVPNYFVQKAIRNHQDSTGLCTVRAAIEDMGSKNIDRMRMSFKHKGVPYHVDLHIVGMNIEGSEENDETG